MTLIGWCPGGRPVADMLKLYPGTRVVRIFVGPGKPLPTWDGPVLGPLVDQDVVVHLSVKTPDWPAVSRLVDSKPPGLLLILTFGHEPEQGTAEGDLPIDQWRACWAELVALLADHPARNELLLVPVYTRYWWQKNAGDLRWLLTVPVDAIGWDVYNNGTTYRTPDDLLSIPRAIAARTGLPYLIAELGAVVVGGDVAGRQAWMRAMVDAARNDGALAVCWFHKDEWDLTGPASAGEQQTWRELIQQEASVTWIQGQPWRVVRSLDRLNAQIRAAYPGAVPPATPAASWGSIADSAHSSTSDHYPHYYSALGKTAVVCARDFPHAPSLGLDAHALADRLRASRDPRIGYVISNGRITGPSHGWEWDDYDGSDPHDTHIHVSTVHTAAADDTRDWQIINGETPEDDMSLFTAQHAAAILYTDARVEAMANGRSTVRADLLGAGSPVWTVQAIKALADAVSKVDEQVAAQLADDFARIDAAVAAAPQLDPKAIAAAIPPELAKQVADELAARLAS